MELFECPVCLDTFRDPQLLSGCGHTFCRQCVEALSPKRCPTCRRAFSRGNVSPNFALRALLEDSRPGAAAPGEPPHFVPASSSSAPAPSPGEKTLARTVSGDLQGLTRHLVGLGIPFGVARLISEEDQRTAMRIFLLDNSGSTSAFDGKRLEEQGGSRPPRFRSCTRWDEIRCMALEQARWNAELKTPCEFVLLNPLMSSSSLQEGVDFQRVDPECGPLEEQISALENMLRKTEPRGLTPIADRVRKIRQRVAQESLELARSFQKVVLIIVTDGLPTSSSSGPSGERDKQILCQELRRLAQGLPVHLVVRLCTEDDSVVDFYNGIDEEVELEMEVIDDMKSEAAEVAKAGNRWLVYSPLMHKIREGGIFMKLFDLIDERRLTASEVSLFCQLLLQQEADEPFPTEPHEFCDDMRQRLETAPEVFDPMLGCMVPPLRIKEVEWAVLWRSSFRHYLLGTAFRASCSRRRSRSSGRRTLRET